MHEVEFKVGGFVPVYASFEVSVGEAIIANIEDVVIFHEVDFNHAVAHVPLYIVGNVVPPRCVAVVVHPVPVA